MDSSKSPHCISDVNEKLPHKDVFVDLKKDGGKPDSLKLTCEITRWEPDNIRIEEMSGGNMNSVLKAQNIAVGDCNALVIKVFGENYKVRENTENMFSAMKVAHAGGVGAPLIAKFTNGVVYGYTEGEMLNPDVHPHDSKYRRLVAQEMARWHCLQPEQLLKPEEVWPREPRMFKDIHHFLSLLDNDFKNYTYKTTIPNFSKDDIRGELVFVEAEFKADEDEVVFAHSDVWWTNIIYNPNTDKIRFIDYDFCDFNYVTREVAIYFNYGQCELTPGLYRGHMFREVEKKEFFREYLIERKRLERNDTPVSQADVDRIYYISKPAEMCLLLDRICFLLAIRNELGIVDFIQICNSFYRDYRSLKDEYKRWKQQHTHL